MNDQLLLLINGWAGQSRLLDGVMIFCATYLIYIVFAVAAAFMAYCVYKREWRSIMYFAATLAVSFILLKIAALSNFDHRPFMDHHLTQLVAHAAGKSFPSDHTTVAAAIAFGLLFTRFKKSGLILIGVACVIGWARVFAGIHYPADILGGLLTAAAAAALVYGVKRIIDTKRTHKTLPSTEKTTV